MRWEEERYVRIYTRDTPDWCVLSWEARALWCLILRKLDRAGLLDLGRHGVRGLAAIVQMPADVVERALPELLADGCVTIRDSLLVAPNFLAAQEARQSDAARQRASRERARSDALSDSVTKRDSASRNVTDVADSVTRGHTASHAVTPSLAVPSCTEPSQEHTHTARAGASAREDREPMSREAGEVLAALRAHPALSAVADVRFAETLDGRRAGKPVAWLAQAIADAAADTPQGETVQAVQRRVRAYCDRARSPADAVARVVPFARPPTGQAAQPITPEGTGWKQNLDERQAAHIAAMIAAGKDAPL